MKFDCDVKTFAKALGAVVRVVPNRATMPILGHVLIDASTDGLMLTATDLEIGIRTSIGAEVAKPGATTVPARLLAGVVGELREDRDAEGEPAPDLRRSVQHDAGHNGGGRVPAGPAAG